jgi:hypothetical protein
MTAIMTCKSVKGADGLTAICTLHVSENYGINVVLVIIDSQDVQVASVSQEFSEFLPALTFYRETTLNWVRP